MFYVLCVHLSINTNSQIGTRSGGSGNIESGSESSISSESGSGWGSNPDLGFDDQKLKKKKNSLVQLNIFLYLFFIKNCNLLISMPPERMSNLQKKPSVLKREQPEKKIY
jgi:hypothetical protein